MMRQTLTCVSSLTQGIQNGWQLPAPCNEDPAGLPHSERLPESLSEAIHSFENPPEGCPGMLLAFATALEHQQQSVSSACLPVLHALQGMYMSLGVVDLVLTSLYAVETRSVA